MNRVFKIVQTLLLALVLVLSSCTPNSYFNRTRSRVKYKCKYKVSKLKGQKGCFVVNKLPIPKGYRYDGIIDGCGTGQQWNYLYEDSSMFYVSSSDKSNTPNYHNVKNVGHRVGKSKFGYRSPAMSDTLDVCGVDQKGNAWRELAIGEFYIGYINATEEKKSIYDKAINKIRFRTKFVGK